MRINRVRIIAMIVMLFVVCNLHAADVRRTKSDYLIFETSVDLKKTIGKKIISNVNFYRAQLKSSKQSRTLNRQLKDERLLIKKIFNAYGFYDALITTVIVNTDDRIESLGIDDFNDYLIENNLDENVLFEKEGYRIAYQFDLGKVYRIEQLEFNDVLQLANLDAGSESMPLFQGASLRAQNVLDAFDLINFNISQNQCFIEGKLSYDVQLDAKKNAAYIEFNYEKSVSSYYKGADVIGLTSINSQWLISQLGLKRNQCLNKSNINNAILKLYATNLIARVSYTLEKTIEKNGTQSVKIHLNVIERKHRTIAAGMGLSTSQGLYLSGSWQHRNVFSKAEQINIETFLGSYEQIASSEIVLPRTPFYELGVSAGTKFHRYSKALDTDFEWLNTLSVFKKINKFTVYNSALELSTKLNIEDGLDGEILNQLYFPNFITWDERDDAVNTTHGIFVQAGITPVWDIKNTEVGFIDYQWIAKGFYTVDTIMPVTLALKYEGRYIDVKKVALLPVDERLYLGGGSNMRGFGFESINANENGGEVFNVFSAETRFRFSQTMGVVGFYDIGYLTQDAKIDVEKQWYSAAGVGFRYYTSFFPIRFDVAVPIKVFDVQTQSFQFYLSIGQSY